MLRWWSCNLALSLRGQNDTHYEIIAIGEDNKMYCRWVKNYFPTTFIAVSQSVESRWYKSQIIVERICHMHDLSCPLHWGHFLVRLRLYLKNWLLFHLECYTSLQNVPLVINNKIGHQNNCSGPYFDCSTPKIPLNPDGPIDPAYDDLYFNFRIIHLINSCREDNYGSFENNNLLNRL